MPNIDLGKVVGAQGPEGPVAQGTMMEATYDPTGKAQDVFAYADTAKQEAKDYAAPKTHASQHASGGSDPITPAAIGAADRTHASQHASGGEDQITPESIGAVKNTGDKMTGNLDFVDRSVQFHAAEASWNTDPWMQIYRDGTNLTIAARNGGKNRSFCFGAYGSDIMDALKLWYEDGDGDNVTFLHTGNLAAFNVCRMEVGTYVGTGTNGCSLTFNDVPKLVFVWGSGHSPLVWTTGMSECTLAGGDTYKLDISLSDKTLSWAYNATGGSSRPYHSLNSEGSTYGYAAFF